MRSRRWALPFGDRADAPYMRRLQYLPPARSCQLRTTPHYRLLRRVYTFLSYHGQADNSRSWFSVLVTRASCDLRALVAPHRSSLPAFLMWYSAARRHMAPFPACLCALLNSQFPRRSECARQHILARRRQANMRVSHLSPAAGNRQENLGRLLHKRRLLLQRKHQISVPLLARPAKQISCLLLEKPAILHESTLPRPPGSGQSCENLLRSSGDSHYVREYLTIIGWQYVHCSGRITGNSEVRAS